MQLAQETCGNIGFLEGLWRFRHLFPDTATEAVQTVKTPEGAGLAP